MLYKYTYYEPDDRESYIGHAFLEPGIKRFVRNLGCEYSYDGGFIPKIIKNKGEINEEKVEISIEKCLNLANSGKLLEIISYVNSLVNPKTTVP